MAATRHMSANARVVHPSKEHINVPKGASAVDKKEFKLGNTTATVYSNLINKQPDQIKEWFKNELSKGNPVCEQIVEAIAQCSSTKSLK